MIRAFFVIIIANLLLSGCTQRMICPAYQSAFIYDKDELRKKFSYFENDTMPKVYTASKNKYLVAEDISYKKKIRTMQTVPMKPVNVLVPDSLQPGYVPGMDEDGVVPGAELDLAARSVIDSIYIEDVPQQDSVATPEEDSVYMISKDKEVRVLRYNFPDSLVYDSTSGKYGRETPKYYVEEVKFNVDQDNYMWYLRDYLVLPDVRLAHMGQQEQAEGAKAKKKKAKKGFFGFFKNLFKKKDKSAPADSTETAPPPKSEDEFDYVDEDSTQQAKVTAQPETQKKEKKGLFGGMRKKDKEESSPAETTSEEKPARRKKDKKKKSDTPEEAAPTEEEKKKEEEDGF